MTPELHRPSASPLPPLVEEDDDTMPAPPTEPGRFTAALDIDLPVRVVVSTRRAFKQRIVAHVCTSGARHFVVDCRHCVEIDGAGWGALGKITRYVKEAGGSFTLVNLPPDLARNLAARSATKFLDIAPPCDDVAIGGQR